MTTAAPSLPLSAQAIASPLTRIFGRPQSSNYLQRLVQDLDPKVAAHHEFCERAFGIAGLVSLIMVPVLFLATGSVVALGLSPFSPLLLIGSSAITGLSIIGISDSLQKCAQKHAYKALFLTNISERLHSLPDDARIIRHQLTLMRVPGSENLNNPTQFRPLIAYYDYWTEKQTSKAAKASSFLSGADRLDAEALAAQEEGNKSSLQKQANDLRLKALESLDKAIIAKINAAFVHAVIQRPEFAGTFDDLAIISRRRPLGRGYDLAAHQFLLFNNPNIRSITRAELSDDTTMPVHRLAERFVQAMAPAAN